MKVSIGRAPGICGLWQGARRSRCRNIDDDEQRRPETANPWRPEGCGGAGLCAALPSLDDVLTSPRSGCLASRPTALATRPMRTFTTAS